MSKQKKRVKRSPTYARRTLQAEGAQTKQAKKPWTYALPQLSLIKTAFALFALLTLLSYWPVLSGKVPFPSYLVLQFPPWETVREASFKIPQGAEMGDLATQFYPWKMLLHEAARQGEWPLWNPYYLMGAPLLANLVSGALSPFNLLCYLLPTPVAWTFGFLLRTLFCGVMTAMAARALGASVFGALAAAIIFTFCGEVTVFQGRPHLDSSLWLPLMCWSVARLFRRPSGASVALVSVAFALPVLGGHPENAFQALLIGAAFFLHRWLFATPEQRAEKAGRIRYLALFTVAGLLAIALAAVQILPALEWLGEIQRSLNISWGAHPLSEALAFVSRDLSSNPNSAGVVIPEGAAYAGMLTLLVAPLALLRRERRDAIFFTVVIIALLEIIYGLWPVYHLSQRLPVLSGIPNWRFLIVVDYCLAILAGFGLTALEERFAEATAQRSARTWWLVWGGALVVWTLVVLELSAATQVRAGQTLDWLASPAPAAWLMLAGAGLLALALARRIHLRWFAVLALLLLSFDLLTFSYNFIPFVPPQELYPPAPVFQFLQRQTGPMYRVIGLESVYGNNYEVAYGLSSAGGYDFTLRRAAELRRPLGEGDPMAFLSRKIVASRSRLLDLLSVKYLVATTWNASAATLDTQPERFPLAFTDGAVRVYENRTALPRAFLVPSSGIEVVADEKTQLARLQGPSFNPETSVIISQALPPFPEHSNAAGQSAPAILSFAQTLNTISLRAEVKEPSLLVLSQIDYPGWKVLVDGAQRPLLRADYAFPAVALESGEHEVRFYYQSPAFRRGLWLTICAALILSGLFISSAIQRRRLRIAASAKPQEVSSGNVN